LVKDPITNTYGRPYQTTRKKVKKALKLFKAKLLRELPEVDPFSMEEFIDTYKGRKRKRYSASKESLEVEPLCRRDLVIQGFVKDQKEDFTVKPNACPRAILPCSYRFNLAIGRYLKALEKPLFSAINAVYRDVTVLKGLNARDRGNILRRKWNKFVDPVAIMLDASRFDQHCSRHILSWEQELQNVVMPECKIYNDMRKKRVIYFRSDEGNIKIKNFDGRLSGAMDTAMGNCLTMSAMTWEYMRSIGIDHYSYANDGDDGVLIVERKHLELIRSTYYDFFRKLGFSMKWEGDCCVFEEIDFCQCRPVFNGTDWVMQRHPTVVMDKDTITLKNVKDKEHLMELANAIGWSGLSVSGNIPVVNEVYRKLAVGEYLPDRPCESGLDYWAVGLDPKFSTPTEDCRVSFYKAFGITPELQVALEREIRSTDWEFSAPATTSMIHAITTNIRTITGH
jgi:hypothetical protein